jgi:IS605 OrfB family transposase
MLVKFACDHEAGVIQLEDTTDLKDALKGTLLGTNWRYHDLHQMVEYKADEAGIKVEYVSGDDMQAATGFRRRVLESAA